MSMAIRDQMVESLDAYKTHGHENVTDAWDLLQQEFECCGIDNFTDWKNSDFGKSGKLKIHY